MKEIKLSELFNKQELKEILALINKSNFVELRKYLNDRKEHLEKKGLVADYLYYVLLNQFGTK